MKKGNWKSRKAYKQDIARCARNQPGPRYMPRNGGGFALDVPPMTPHGVIDVSPMNAGFLAATLATVRGLFSRRGKR